MKDKSVTLLPANIFLPVHEVLAEFLPQSQHTSRYPGGKLSRIGGTSSPLTSARQIYSYL